MAMPRWVRQVFLPRLIAIPAIVSLFLLFVWVRSFWLHMDLELVSGVTHSDGTVSTMSFSPTVDSGITLFALRTDRELPSRGTRVVTQLRYIEHERVPDFPDGYVAQLEQWKTGSGTGFVWHSRPYNRGRFSALVIPPWAAIALLAGPWVIVGRIVLVRKLRARAPQAAPIPSIRQRWKLVSAWVERRLLGGAVLLLAGLLLWWPLSLMLPHTLSIRLGAPPHTSLIIAPSDSTLLLASVQPIGNNMSDYQGLITLAGSKTPLPRNLRSFLGFGWSTTRTPTQRHVTTIPFWCPTLLLTLVVGLLVYRRRLRTPMPEGLCQTCGYDLRASKERCPECGTPIPAPPVLGGRVS